MKYDIYQLQLCGRKRSATVLKNGNVVTTLSYERWFSKKAAATVSGLPMEINPADFWCRRMSIYYNHRERGTLQFNWKGNMRILLDKSGDHGSHKLLLRSGGAFSSRYLLVDETQPDQRIELISTGKIFSFKKEFTVKGNMGVFEAKPEEILLYCAFGIQKAEEAKVAAVL